MPQPLSREEAWTLLSEWVASPGLRRHCLAVEASMRFAARRLGADEALWAVTGLLHDADYERHPDMDDEEAGHPRTIMAELRARDADPAIIEAIAGHAPYLGVPRETDLAKWLFAVDELSGFLLAVAYVRPEGIHGMTPKSVKKKLKQPSFAAAVSREDVQGGAAEVGMEFDDLCRLAIDALEAEADALELHGSAAGEPATPPGSAAA
jgi:putative nucleotidyltransferase with HDIG domain